MRSKKEVLAGPSVARRLLGWSKKLLLLGVVPAALGYAQARLLNAYIYGEIAPVETVQPAKVVTQDYGPLCLTIKLPGTHAGIPEPLASIGMAGNASLIFIRLLSDSRAKVGIEFWGDELTEGDAFQVPAPDAEITVTCYVPALFPGKSNALWKGVPPEKREKATGAYLIQVDGITRLEGRTPYVQPEDSPIYIGTNPLGGSFVSNKFTGAVLKMRRSP